MKTCSYCGKQYPDDATVCPADGETLPGSFEDRKKVTGVWRGIYGYGQRGEQPGLGPVAFTLKLKQGWLAHFDGSVTEDAPQGNPYAGTVDGYFNSPNIEFTKQMPVGYAIGADGKLRTLREHLLAGGHPCEHELPSPPIFYQGTFLDANRMQGIWVIPSRRIPLPGGLSIATAQASGFWCAEFIASDAKTDLTGGPTQSLFDKSLLSPRELEEVEGVAFDSLGKFNVADAGKLLERFGQENIRFEIKRDDEAMSQTMPIMEMTGGYAGTAEMIEILVHPEDVPEAEAILHPVDPV
jgi:hypothetical protein